MAALIELKTFYQHLNRDAAEMNNEIGHFNIFRVEDLLLPRDRPITYSRRNFFKISLVKGHSRIHYADKVIEVHDTGLVFTNPMIPFHWERMGETHSGYVCVFTEDFFNRFGNSSIKDYPVFQLSDAAVIPLKEEDATQYNQLFSRMLDELQGNYSYKYDLLRHLLMEIVHGAQKMQPATGDPVTGHKAAERIVTLFTELLERQFPIELNSQTVRLTTPSDFARNLNIHVNHLNKALKEITGHTTTQLINGRLLQEARILLKSTSWTINEIAWCLGFEEPNHFSSFFKNQTRITPRKFRLEEID